MSLIGSASPFRDDDWVMRGSGLLTSKSGRLCLLDAVVSSPGDKSGRLASSTRPVTLCPILYMHVERSFRVFFLAQDNLSYRDLSSNLFSAFAV